jgi:hypothetical protein
MRLRIALAALVLAGFGAVGCGRATPASRVPSNAAAADAAGTSAPGRTAAGDGAYDDNHDDYEVLYYGHAADAAETHVIVGAVRRYYAAAIAGDGAMACSMLSPSMARSAPEDYGRAPGPAYLRGSKTCATVMSRLFRHVHKELTGTIRVTGVRIGGARAFALLRSQRLPYPYVSLGHEGGAWRIQQLVGGQMP